jgi:hypothetical protein
LEESSSKGREANEKEQGQRGMEEEWRGKLLFSEIPISKKTVCSVLSDTAEFMIARQLTQPNR